MKGKLKVLIIGANGFIGKHLSKHLSGNELIELTLFSRKYDNDFFNSIKHKNNVKFVIGDYKNIIELNPIVFNQDIVYHLVSISFPSSTWNSPEVEIVENLLPSVQFFKACADAKVKKIVYISSGGAVYGNITGIINEETPLKPFSPYGIVKSSIEYFLEYFRIKSNINYDIFRVSNAYGPLQNKRGFGVINTWLNAIKDNEELIIFGNGENQKDYIYVEDLIKLISISVYLNFDKSEIYNIGSGKSYSLNEILFILKSLINNTIYYRYVDSFDSDNKHVELEISKILCKFKNFNFTSISDGILKTWTSILENKKS